MVNRIPLSHYKSLVGGGALVVGPIDKELLGKDAAIDKLEIMNFEQVRMIKELNSEIKVL